MNRKDAESAEDRKAKLGMNRQGAKDAKKSTG